MDELRELSTDDLPRIVATAGGVAWNGGFQKWNQRLAEHQDGRRLVLLAVEGTHFLGYGSLLWLSAYSPFRELGIPEIQDLVVAESRRGQGVATRIIVALEDRARLRGHKQIGLGVGLYADYGPAQRLYVRLGYMPDGRGLTYRTLPAPGGANVRVDDDLLVWLVKSL
jgi:GNAT superfamily N-acetyltransferase